MKSLCAFLVVLAAALTNFALAAKLRSSPSAAPAASPAGSPAGAPAASPAAPAGSMEEAIEAAHHATTMAVGKHALAASAEDLKEASITHAEAGVHVADAKGHEEAQ